MKLGTKLIVYLVGVVVLTMLVHGYLSVRQDRENLVSEIRVGMRGFSRAVEAALRDLYADNRDLKATQEFVDRVGPRGNIHGIIVYDLQGRRVAVSRSLTESFPGLDPTAILALDPASVLQKRKGTEGYLQGPGLLVYYHVEPIISSENKLAGAFLLGRQGHGWRLAETIKTRRDRIVITTSVLVLVLSLLILLIVRRNVSRPIDELIERIREIGKGHWEQRIQVMGKDEVSLLASEFNRLSERLRDTYRSLVNEQQQKLELEKDLRHSERLASVGQLAAGLAHEIGTPLNIIGGRAEYLTRRPRSTEELNENLLIIREQIDRIAGIVRQLLEFSRRKEPSLRTVDIASLLAQVRQLVQHKLDEKGIKVDLEVSEPLPEIQADPDLLQQLFLNLYLNSLHGLGHGGRISIRVQASDNGIIRPSAASGVRWLGIAFEDNGPGIRPEHLDRVFDPFFTTKDIGEGTGLGLSVSYGIVRDHGGEIRVESEAGKYARFVIQLPVTPSDESASRRGLHL
ncbi:MAG: HAMP domain-containing protein [Deltaproteobacteria bacterium]|nr:HAMP domain-containing protein [Deltaproteobacteria bacterium]